MHKPLIEIKHVCKNYGNTPVLRDICIDVNSGEFLTLLGPSGCGKTTLLRMISGFESPTSGEIYLNQVCVNNLPPQQRDVHTVFQSYALFPHLNVFENVAFALRCKRAPEAEIKKRVFESLELVQLQAFAERTIQQLSGGQQQRVAIARAIVSRPQVLLLDEPLSSLDYILRQAMQRELKTLQKHLNMTFIFVTHDQEEALSMSDRIVVLKQGHIEQIGTPREIYETPQNLNVANFIGQVNVFDVYIQSEHADHVDVEIEGVSLRCLKPAQSAVGKRYHLIIRPEDLNVWKQSEVDDTTGMLPAIITDIIYKGSTVDLKVALSSGRSINASEFFNEDDDKLEYSLQEQVWIQWLIGWEVLLPYEN